MKSSTPVTREYAKLARDYDRKWSFYIEASIRKTLARLQLSPESRVLDVGCGTGALLAELRDAQPAIQLTGVDPVEAMLTIARERLPEDVVLRSAWAEELPFADGSFDRVISCNMFHYVRQPLQALREMKRVLTPGGELVLTDWCDDYLSCKVCGLYLRIIKSAHHKAYSTSELRELLDAASLQQLSVERYKINWLWGLMTARASPKSSTEG